MNCDFDQDSSSVPVVVTLRALYAEGMHTIQVRMDVFMLVMRKMDTLARLGAEMIH